MTSLIYNGGYIHDPIASCQEPLSVRKSLSAPKGLWNRITQLADTNPRVRYTLDITIIVLGILSIVGVLIASQGQGLLVFGIIPGLVLVSLGLTLLVSDVASTEKKKEIAEMLTAIFVPLVLLGLASALFAGAYFTCGASALILASPLFIMGTMTVGLSLVSLNKVTFQYFHTRSLIKSQNAAITLYERDAEEHSIPEVSKTTISEKITEKDPFLRAKSVILENRKRRKATRQYIRDHIQANLITRDLDSKRTASEKALLPTSWEYEDFTETCDFSQIHSLLKPDITFSTDVQTTIKTSSKETSSLPIFPACVVSSPLPSSMIYRDSKLIESVAKISENRPQHDYKDNNEESSQNGSREENEDQEDLEENQGNEE
ncbi:hypothetical protein CP10139811_0375 [Chlamydia ibidis]|uniref:Uncharacterized protein n=2 Tax=Chlamydia ibidis TaxID=1405396 RepID=S7J1S8_9CHLA|nr:Yip1 family protein [Chlamydia ibidis]EPP34354.1 hypothetical protein CP10139811_0375 [Chlamydia ibidis]EQM63228.1 hypothetical protein H359_0380 [Chlamydia ibidis 10-1398/6]